MMEKARERISMKPGNALVNFVMIVMAFALACYMGVYVYNGFSDPFTTAYAYEYEYSDGVEVQGFLVRQELVLPQQAGIVDVVRGEGERVGKGQTVALIHRDSSAVDLQDQLDALELEISLLDYALGQGDTISSTAQLDQAVLNAIISLRGSTAVNNYSRLEKQSKELKSQVLKREYTYNDDLDISQLQQQRSILAAEYSALKAQSSGITSQVTAPDSGTFSALVDGYEEVLTPESILTMTPSQLDALRGQRVVGSDALGKLVTENTWYYVTSVSQEDAQRLRKGGSVILGFLGEFSQNVDMTVVQVGEVENGRCAVVLSTMDYLGDTILLREQTVELVFEQVTGLRVPKLSLRMVTKTTTDPDSGETIESQELGVYALIGGQAEFKKVEILSEGTDYYVVKPTTSGSRALRSGDEVIVRAVELYDGKVMEYN